MSTLKNLSCLIGRAIKLPPVFYREVPFIGFLDKGLTNNTFGRPGTSSRRFRNRAQHAGFKRPSHTGTQNVVLEGEISSGAVTRFSINGIDFCVSAGTWIIGDPLIGCSARVKGIRGSDDVVLASSLVVLQ